MEETREENNTMTEEKKQRKLLEAVDVSSIEEKGTFIGRIMYKPYTSVYVGWVTGVVIIVAVRNLWAILLGGFFIVLATIVFTRVQDYKVCDVYDDAVVIYQDESGEKAARVPLEEIAEWNVLSNNTASNAIMFKLQDGYVFYKNTFRVSEAHKYLFKALPSRETRQLEIEKNRNTKWEFRNPFKGWFKK